MDTIRIFLSGGMSNISHERQWAWRKEVDNKLSNFRFGCEREPEFFNPCMYYSTDEKWHKTEKEPFEFDIYNLRKSDLVIVNFNDPKSIGVAMELMLAKELYIPVIGLNDEHKELHPWLVECCSRICDSMDELVDYVGCYYLN